MAVIDGPAFAANTQVDEEVVANGSNALSCPDTVDANALKESNGVGKGRGKARGKGSKKSKGKGKGRSKGKSKGKGKGKGTRDAKARANTPADDSAQIGETDDPMPVRAVKAPKLGLRSQVLSSVANREIEDVIAETKAEVQAMQKHIEKAAEEERSIEGQLVELSKALAEASSKVEDGVKQEELALDRLRTTRESQIEATRAAMEARMAQEEVIQQIRTLELEVQARLQVSEYEQAKQAAREAAEAAKRALQEAKLKEKEAAEAMKKALKEQRQKAPVAIMDRAEGQEQDATGNAKPLEKEVLKTFTLEIKAIEKLRLEREKRRVASLKEATASGKGRGKGKSVRGREVLSRSVGDETLPEMQAVEVADGQ
eukprot:TRINITY_DN1664_c4_g1_i1.p1 TRINITY_DN1664_c4_g1~~TRINITY_DN1664_c4_g1_i1.p1  ORF type:complete len:372 (+),score=104.11 TRINITY_DN1664_c4_g1_i1:51-1166(+)